MEMLKAMNIIPLLQTGGAGQYMFFITLGLVFLIFYFLLIRPQRKEQKEMAVAIAALKKGDKVITIGGIHGMVALTKERTIILKVDDNCKIEISRNAIATVLKDGKESEKSVAKEASNDKKDATSEPAKKGFFAKFASSKENEESDKDKA